MEYMSMLFLSRFMSMLFLSFNKTSQSGFKEATKGPLKGKCLFSQHFVRCYVIRCPGRVPFKRISGMDFRDQNPHTKAHLGTVVF